MFHLLRKFAIGLVLLVAVLIFINNFIHGYEPKVFDGDDACYYVEEKCTCYGTLQVLESFPEQYLCKGFTTCKEMERERFECIGDSDGE